MKWIIVGVLFLNSVLNAQDQPEKRHICQAALYALRKLEIVYIPEDRMSCRDPQECTYRIEVPWKVAEGVNKTTLAAYQLMTLDNQYLQLKYKVVENCKHRHPKIVFPRPVYVDCIARVCTPIF